MSPPLPHTVWVLPSAGVLQQGWGECRRGAWPSHQCLRPPLHLLAGQKLRSHRAGRIPWLSALSSKIGTLAPAPTHLPPLKPDPRILSPHRVPWPVQTLPCASPGKPGPILARAGLCHLHAKTLSPEFHVPPRFLNTRPHTSTEPDPWSLGWPHPSASVNQQHHNSHPLWIPTPVPTGSAVGCV